MAGPGRRPPAAAKALTGALKEVSTTEELYGLAGVVAELNDATLFGLVTDKIKTKAGRAGDFARLARMLAKGGDQARAVETVNEGAAKYGSPADLIALSGAMNEIDPAAAGALYDKALESAKDFTALMQVLAAAAGNAEFAGAVLAKAGAVATVSGELIELAGVYANLNDATGVTDMLDKAEESVANLAEMRKVVEAVEKFAAADAPAWSGSRPSWPSGKRTRPSASSCRTRKASAPRSSSSSPWPIASWPIWRTRPTPARCWAWRKPGCARRAASTSPASSP